MSEASKGQQAAEWAVRLSAGAGAAVVGGVVAGPVGAALGAVAQEAVNEAAQRLIKVIIKRREERAAQVMAVGAEVSNVSIDRFSETVESSPELLALLAETVQAAMETPLEAKIYALGRCLAGGVQDDTRVDAERLRVRGLARIETQEVKLMAVLNEEAPLRPADPERGIPENGRWLGWPRTAILEQLPGLTGVLDASIALLVAEGLAIDAGVGTFGGGGPGREQWILTDFGKDCLQLLQDVAPAVDPMM
ncbi:hypothetical protein OOK06_02010 [Streptomyces sp. NBC_00340]|uniref:hypothetical protein n=1 Tax=Streptomyces sp. NBC_00340 TaxID=2975716 RepID=UPI00225BAA5A|nr:hypothetical protein [Streptomyces sp. NBC_00340]MCX5130872.1 hypothetical protein [Streptomyces sp. NBC_00340]